MAGPRKVADGNRRHVTRGTRRRRPGQRSRAAHGIWSFWRHGRRTVRVTGRRIADGAAPYDRVTFTVRSEQPLRVSVQFQPVGRAEGWQRSVYVDETSREQTVRFAEATPIAAARTRHPDPKDIHDILFVIDTTHAKPGASSRLWLKSAALQR